MLSVTAYRKPARTEILAVTKDTVRQFLEIRPLSTLERKKLIACLTLCETKRGTQPKDWAKLIGLSLPWEDFEAIENNANFRRVLASELLQSLVE